MCVVRGWEQREEKKKGPHRWSIGCPHCSQVAFDLQENGCPTDLRTDKSLTKVDKNDPDIKIRIYTGALSCFLKMPLRARVLFLPSEIFLGHVEKLYFFF